MERKKAKNVGFVFNKAYLIEYSEIKETRLDLNYYNMHIIGELVVRFQDKTSANTEFEYRPLDGALL